MNQIMLLQKFRKCLKRFRLSHPKFPLFIKTVSKEALREGTLIEINVTSPEGKTYCSNVRLKAEDMELVECLKSVSLK